MKQIKLYIPLIIMLFCISNIYAQDWPQYLGPDRNSVSAQKNILRSWPQKGPEVLWTVNVELVLADLLSKTVRSIYWTEMTKLAIN